jgi:predicted deacylase
MTVKIVTYRPLQPGPALTVLGAVHGNERCGAEAIGRMIADIDDGVVALKRGTLQLVPVTNPRAFQEGVRFVERNLNRYLYPKEEKVHYEDHLDPILCGLLDMTNVLLDLHSYTSQGGPFIFLGGDNSNELAFARALGVPDFACGWAEAFGGGDGIRESQGTTEYARTQGAIAVTLECGHHFNPDAADIGYRAILLAMAHLDMLDTVTRDALGPNPGVPAGKQRFVRMKSVFRREEGAVMAKPWRHFDAVAKGEAMAKLSSGKILPAPEDGFIVLPKEKAVTGEEWFFFGTPTALPA